MTDRNSGGILTQNHRQWLKGEKMISDTNEENYRSRIRRNLRNAILDLALINNHLSHEEIVKALEVNKNARHRTAPPGVHPDDRPDRAKEVLGDRVVAKVDPEVFENYVEVVVFLYRIAGFSGLRRTVKEGVEEIYDRYRDDAILRSVDFSWDAELKENLVRRGEQKMDQGEPLSKPERDALMDSENHTAEEIGRYVDEHPRKQQEEPEDGETTLGDSIRPEAAIERAKDDE